MGRPFVAGFPGRLFLIGLVICWMVAVSGCQRTIVPVAGRVTLNGKPLADAVVTFQPQAERDKKYPAATGSVGHTDNEGRYTLRVVKPDQLGAVVGDHIVTISTSESGSDKALPTAEPLPQEWRDGSKSFRVPPNGTREADFAITITEPPPKASKKRK
jgi:hypothetical protein